MSHKDGRVMLTAWVDPVLRDHARAEASSSGMEFSRWVERALQKTMARESAARAVRCAELTERANHLRLGSRNTRDDEG